MIGQTISHYKITEKLGEGGMGVVYKAQDTNLDRTVALKFLAAHLLGSEEHKQRFLREAKAAASLDHPNICMVHEVGEADSRVFLAIGYVDGREVSAKIKERPLKLDEALDIAVQAAEGLRAAHQKGIVHRDIKSSNLMLTSTGQVKIMDFGLAQLSGGTRLTKTDTILGTPAYMSPEQAQRLATDRRSDIWSLGVVLYEMVTGRLPFEGEREQAVVYSIINEPHEPITAIRAGVPLELDRIVGKALAKNPAERYQHLDDLLVDLRAITVQLESGKFPARQPAATTPRRRGYVWAGAATVGLLAVLLALASFWKGAPPTSAEWERITDFPDSATSPAVSPDGRMITFIRGGSTFFGKGEIYVKMLPDGQPVQLTNDGLSKMSPVFSPDGSRIAYTVVEGNSAWDTWIVPVLGGEPRRWLPNASGLVWIDKRRVLFSEIKTGIHMALVTATESRGEARDLYVPPHERGMAHRSYLSPDGKWVLLAEMDNQGFLPCRVVPFDGSSAGRRVGPSGPCTSAAWSADGEQMYLASNSGGSFHIWRQRFPEGPPEQITSGPTQEEGVVLTPDGRYLLTSVGMAQSAVWVRDQRGERQVSFEGNAILSRSESTSLPQAFSPDGRRLYYLAGGALWTAELDSGRNERLLPDFEHIATYDISRDGKQVAFSTVDSENRSHLWLAPLDLSSPPKTLGPADADCPHFGRDGEIFFRGIEDGRNFVFRLAADHEQSEKVVSDPVVSVITASPGGEWVVGAASGYVTAYPAEGGAPVRLCAWCLVGWTGDGKSLFVSRFVDTTRRHVRTYVLSIPAGSAFPRLPPGGIETEEQLAALGGVLLGEGGINSPGPDASVYAFTRSSEQRNIYRIPLR